MLEYLKKPFRKKILPVTLFFLFWIVYFSQIWSHAITFDKDGNVMAGAVGIWADWALHFTLGSAMAARDLILIKSPLLLNAPFSYPFLCNVISALLIRIGIPFFKAFTYPSFLFSILFIFSLFWFYKTLFKSQTIALLASLIFLFNGGFGFLEFFKDIIHSSHPFYTLFFPPQTYTKMDSLSIHWISVITSMIIPQRSFQLGFPLALICLTYILKVLHPLGPIPKKGKRGRPIPFIPLIAISILMGYMPIVHTYSFLALFIILGSWVMAEATFLKRDFFKLRLKYWLTILGVTSGIAIPLLLIFIINTVNQPDFIQWHPGWYARSEEIGWIQFWWRNWGVTLILGFLGFLAWIFTEKSSSSRIKRVLIIAPFILFFALINLFLFQPWIWDNTKILIWASLGISGWAAYFVHAFLFVKKPPKIHFPILTPRRKAKT